METGTREVQDARDGTKCTTTRIRTDGKTGSKRYRILEIKEVGLFTCLMKTQITENIGKYRMNVEGKFCLLYTSRCV